MKKFLAVTVILLFIGLAVAPSINANASKESLIEFTTEVCGLDGRKQTVKLSQEEANEVEVLFDSIRKRLNVTESIEETEEIFKEAIVKLNKYGLLGGLSVEKVQNLITGRFQNLRIAKFLEKANINSFIKGNFLCLLNGKTDYTMFDGFFSTLLLILSFLFIGLDIFVLLWMSSYYFTNSFPLSLSQTVSLGVQGVQWTYPANGWVFTNGLTGVKKWEGNIIGDICLGILDEFIGVTGFTGIKITNSDSNYVYYMGFARRVKIKELD